MISHTHCFLSNTQVKQVSSNWLSHQSKLKSQCSHYYPFASSSTMNFKHAALLVTHTPNSWLITLRLFFISLLHLSQNTHSKHTHLFSRHTSTSTSGLLLSFPLTQVVLHSSSHTKPKHTWLALMALPLDCSSPSILQSYFFNCW